MNKSLTDQPKGPLYKPLPFSTIYVASLISIDGFLLLLGEKFYRPCLFKHKVKLKTAIYSSISVQ